MSQPPMSELDFLPDWYLFRLERRHGYFVFVWLGVCLVGAMGLWFYLVHSQVRQCRADLQQLKAERNTVNDQLLKIDKLRAVRDDLTRKSDIARQLHNRPDVIHVSGRLVELAGDDVNLVDMKIVSEEIKPPSPSAGPSGRSGGRAAPAAPGAVPQDPPKVRYGLTVTGVAPSDVSIANFIARLSASDAFVDVQMGYTKDVKRSGRLMRQFELTGRLVEDCRAADESGPAGNAAPAGH